MKTMFNMMKIFHTMVKVGRIKMKIFSHTKAKSMDV
jgi:hypothetical protein